MNRSPLWKYRVILVALAIGFLYTLPNFFGEAPAVQVSSGKATVKVDLAVQQQVEGLLAAANLQPDGVFFDQNGTSGSVRVRFADTDTQLKAKDVLARGLNTDPTDPTYIVALNLLSGSPRWLTSMHALPMFLGLDLRGGVHFLLQVDMNGALTKKLDSLAGDIRTQLRDKGIRHSGIDRSGTTLSIKFNNPDDADRARTLLSDSTRELAYNVDKTADGATLTSSRCTTA
jgi:preprotein translocase subunit SecD